MFTKIQYVRFPLENYSLDQFCILISGEILSAHSIIKWNEEIALAISYSEKNVEKYRKQYGLSTESRKNSVDFYKTNRFYSEISVCSHRRETSSHAHLNENGRLLRAGKSWVVFAIAPHLPRRGVAGIHRSSALARPHHDCTPATLANAQDTGLPRPYMPATLPSDATAKHMGDFLVWSITLDLDQTGFGGRNPT